MGLERKRLEDGGDKRGGGGTTSVHLMCLLLIMCVVYGSRDDILSSFLVLSCYPINYGFNYPRNMFPPSTDPLLPLPQFLNFSFPYYLSPPISF